MSVSNFKDFLNVYEFSTVLEGSGETIRFRPLVTKQLKKLFVSDAETNPDVGEAVLDELIQECVINEGFKVEELYLLDRISLLFEIRKKSKGETISTTKKCNKCGLETLFTIDLNNVTRKTYVKTDELVSVASDNIQLKLDHLRRKDQKEIFEKFKKNKKEKSESFDINRALLAKSIVSVKTSAGEDDSLSLDDKIYIIDNLSTFDLNKITDWHTNNSFGVDFNYEFKCAHCDNSEKMEIPLNDFLS